MIYTFPCSQLLEEQRESIWDAEDEVLGKGVSSEAGPRCVGMGLQPPALWGTSCHARPALSASLLLRQRQSGVSRVSSPCLSSETPAASCPNKHQGAGPAYGASSRWHCHRQWSQATGPPSWWNRTPQ